MGSEMCIRDRGWTDVKGRKGEGQHVFCEACEGAAVAGGLRIRGNVFF